MNGGGRDVEGGDVGDEEDEEDGYDIIECIATKRFSHRELDYVEECQIGDVVVPFWGHLLDELVVVVLGWSDVAAVERLVRCFSWKAWRPENRARSIRCREILGRWGRAG